MSSFEEYVDLARSRIKELPTGTYKLGQIFGELWPAVPDHNGLGIYFKAQVLAGKVDRLEWFERGTDNNHRYRIL